MALRRALKIVLLAVLLAAYVYWSLNTAGLTVSKAAAAALSLILFALCAVFFIDRLFDFWQGKLQDSAPQPGMRSSRRELRHPWLKIVLWVLISRAVVYVAAYALTNYMQGYQGGIIDTMGSVWLRSDAPHYLGLAENWYVTSGDPRFHIVFLPFYPIMIKAAWFIFKNYLASAFVVSCLSAAGAGILLYELALLDAERKTALNTVKYAFLLPAAFFYNAPMSESLFLLLSVACIYLLRKKRYLPACIIGGLAAFTRSLGLMLIVAAGVEYIAELIDTYKAQGKGAFYRQLATRGLCLLLIPAGFLAYVYINYAVTGNPWQFLEYQSSHWGQRLGLFFNTAGYQTDHLIKALAEGDFGMALGLWIPNLAFIFGSLLLMAPAVRRLRPSYSAYFIAYFAVAIGATWLLSAPRYLTAAFPLSMALADMTKHRFVDAAATILLALLQLFYLWAYVSGCPVY